MINLLLHGLFFYYGVDLSSGDANCGHDVACPTGLPVVDAGGDQLQQILQIVFGIAGALAVLFIVIGGLRLVLSQGSPQDTAKGRSTIIYALVGLLVAITGEAIVSFVLQKL